ncbi:MAG: cobalamin-dependent protein [Ignavibacteriaceae bacterium]
MNELNKIISDKINELKKTLPELILEKHLNLQPKLKAVYTERHRRLYLENTWFHLSYLAGSIFADEPVLFTEYISWAKTFFSTLPIDENDIILNLELIRDSLETILEPDLYEITLKYINAGIEIFKSHNVIPVSFINDSNPLSVLANKYLSFLIKGNKQAALNIILETIEAGTPLKDIYLNVFQETQKETGRLWQLSKITVAQEHFITAATQLIMAQLYTYLFTSEKKNKTIIVSCVQGELHEIGARMVADLFEMDGWNSYYFGANTPNSSITKAIEIYRPDILAISATMTYNLSAVSELIERIRKNPNINYVKIMAGGYPFNLAADLWQNMGADGSARNAPEAIQLASTLLQQPGVYNDLHK